ncbi:MAG: carbamoyl-phosphate synthase large subunit, partial [Alphaproteobacteria bacterium]|nr:carbamoyl-phosphate synthase large subunit [Alphaproteobacteria bacterium]
LGFSDAQLASIMNVEEEQIRKERWKHNIHPVYKRVDTCAAEIPSSTPYMYSCYEPGTLNGDIYIPTSDAQEHNKEVSVPSITHNEIDPSDKEKVIILGGGPNRIGQGIEFDYCCVHAAYALKDAGYETIMVNCNPETVSTDYDTSDRLYFEPLTEEDVIELIKAEIESVDTCSSIHNSDNNKQNKLKGVIVQLGGQTPLKLANSLLNAGIPILGTDPDAIDLAEDRERFQKLINDIGLKQPLNGLASNAEEAFEKAENIGFPLVIRPSYVLGGDGMQIVHDMEQLKEYINTAVKISGNAPVLLDRYLKSAIEIDVDALCDGEDVYVSGIMEHIEEAGVHSGDSACVLPPHSLSREIVDELEKQTIKLAKSLKVIGLMNVQFAVRKNDETGKQEIFIIEVNPRASRTVPFVAKATGVPVAKIAALLMTGKKLADFKDVLLGMRPPHYAVKAPVFPFNRFTGVEPLLGPEMKSTGEVMGLDKDLACAIAKSQLGAGIDLPIKGKVFLSVKDDDKKSLIPIAKELSSIGFTLIATGGTCRFLKENGLEVERINKVMQGQPHIVDAIINGEIDLMINTTTKSSKAVADSGNIRRMALMNKIPYYTLLTAATAGVQAIKALKSRDIQVASLQSYFKEIGGHINSMCPRFPESK